MFSQNDDTGEFDSDDSLHDPNYDETERTEETTRFTISDLDDDELTNIDDNHDDSVNESRETTYSFRKVPNSDKIS